LAENTGYDVTLSEEREIAFQAIAAVIRRSYKNGK
jgi:hypothetical protein